MFKLELILSLLLKGIYLYNFFFYCRAPFALCLPDVSVVVGNRRSCLARNSAYHLKYECVISTAKLSL
jgi:hypothetical protein